MRSYPYRYTYIAVVHITLLLGAYMPVLVQYTVLDLQYRCVEYPQ